jgi:thiamine kinase-like enzyme
LTEGATGIDYLKQQCATALAVFGLSIDEGADDTLLVLKQDQDSRVLRIRCLEDGVSKHFVVKYRSAQDKLVSFALTAKLEKLLRSEHNSLVWSEAQAASPLIPRRKKTSSGQAYWLSDQADQQTQERGCWSVSEYLPNGPAFGWLENPPRWTSAHAHSAGTLLAKLHCAGRQAKEKLTGAEAHQLASLLPKLPQLLTSSIRSRQNDRPQNALFSSEETIDALGDAVTGAVSALTTGQNAAVLVSEALIVHGDFHPGNVLFADTTALAAIDLDFAHLEHPLYDLAYALLIFAPTAQTRDSASSLLAGYSGYFERCALEPPSFLPPADHIAAQTATQIDAPITDCSSGPPQADLPYHQYVVVAASLILLWTLSEAGAQHADGESLANRMINYIVNRVR